MIDDLPAVSLYAGQPRQLGRYRRSESWDARIDSAKSMR
jgi:hypothetical protein